MSGSQDAGRYAVRRGRLHRRTGAGLGLPVAVAAVGLGLALVGQQVVVRPAVQDDLAARTVAALQKAGLADVTVDVSGRDVTLNVVGASNADVQRAVEVAQGVSGVRVVSEVFVRSGPSASPSPGGSAGASPSGAAAPASPSGSAGASPSPSGADPSSSTSASPGASGGGLSAGDVSVPSAPVAMPALPAGVGQLVRLAAYVDDGRVRVVGVLPTENARRSLTAQLTPFFGTDMITNDVLVEGGAGTVGAETFARVVTTLSAAPSATVSLWSGRLHVAGVSRDRGVLALVEAQAAEAVAQGPLGLTDTLAVDPSASGANDVQAAAMIEALPPVAFAPGRTTPAQVGQRVTALSGAILARHPSLRVTVQAFVPEADATGERARTLTAGQASAVVDALRATGADAARIGGIGYGTAYPLVSGSGAGPDTWNRRVLLRATPA